MALPGEPIYRLPVTEPRPKGLAPWAPRPGSKNARLLSGVQVLVERYQDRWPLGPREIGYLLTADEFGFTHDDVPLAEKVVARARRAGLIPWEAISDGRTSAAAPWVPGDGAALATALLDELPTAQLDRQEGQAVRVELWAEAAGWLPRLERNAHECGVPVFSGSGSVPVPAVRGAALRALHAHPARTVLLSIGDLDLNGLRNIARPFEEDVLQMAADLLTPAAERLNGTGVTVEAVGEFLTVRRLLVTPDQVTEHVGEHGRRPPTDKARQAGWPWPWTVQAEAVPPEVRDRIVAEAIDALHDLEVRQAVIDREPDLHEAARAALAERTSGR